MHKTDKIFLAITKKAIFMIIPFFVQVTGFVHLSKLHFKCDRAVCRMCLSISLHLPAIHSPCLSPRLSTRSSTYLLSALSLIALWVMEEQRVCLWRVKCHGFYARCNRGELTWFWREDVSQLLDDLLELQHCILFVLHIISCHTHTHRR